MEDTEQAAKPGFSYREMMKWIRRRKYYPRTFSMSGDAAPGRFPKNVICNQKYNLLTFLPLVLIEQFRVFLNLYFLGVALTQFVPFLRVGFLFTYILPLVVVLSITIAKEAIDDIQRMRRDRSVNLQKYERITPEGTVLINSADIKVGHYIRIRQDQRVPADMILLRTTGKGGASFIRTDGLDGETDWKLRYAVHHCQQLARDEDLLGIEADVFAEAPKRDIYSFIGTFTHKEAGQVASLGLENTLWASTVVASGTVVGLVVYTGRETRAQRNTSAPRTKTGKVDSRVNALTKVLFALTFALSCVLIFFQGFRGAFYIYFVRYMLLFSSIIPISLRVNLDMAKVLYSWIIGRDKAIPGTVVRSTTIPEELGLVEYLLSDKTGTLTCNDMIFQKLHMGSLGFTSDDHLRMAELLSRAARGKTRKRSHTISHLNTTFDDVEDTLSLMESTYDHEVDTAHEESVGLDREASMLYELILAMALCHNVSPVTDSVDTEDIHASGSDIELETMDVEGEVSLDDGDEQLVEIVPGRLEYQASSPDEVALVKQAEALGLALVHRSTMKISLRSPSGELEGYEILNTFPFSSETKRMGIIVRDINAGGRITFFMKGADTVMARIVRQSDWLEEECLNMAQDGLRTLVFAKRVLNEEEYTAFNGRYVAAKNAITDREFKVMQAQESIETGMTLLGVTGVEDRLQDQVRETLEILRNAGVKVWMLTGDKVETGICIAVSAKLIQTGQSIVRVIAKDKDAAREQLLSVEENTGACLVLDGHTLQICLDHYRDLFCTVASKAPTVVCCRCSPRQKADVVSMVQKQAKGRVCAIGDGGNDVNMIQAAHVGLGIEGKEGKQASLAADFSITQFSHVVRLLLWHGRNSYKRTASLSQFIFHRGLIISFIQAVFSAIFYFVAIAVYNGWLLVGYTTVYTMLPVFCLTLDEDLSQSMAFRYPELYQDLRAGKDLSYKKFFVWVLQSVYQGAVIMILSLFLFESMLINVVAISFSALVVTELINVAMEIHKWSLLIIVSEIATFLIFLISILFLPTSYISLSFVLSLNFAWKCALLVFCGTFPILIIKFVKKRLDPPVHVVLANINKKQL